MMMSLHKVSTKLKIGLPLIASGLISACGTSYKVHNVQPADLVNSPKPGLYYYLPKTRVTIEGIATGTKPEYGIFSSSDKPLLKGNITLQGGKVLESYNDVLEHNRGACGTGSRVVVLSKQGRVNTRADHDYVISKFSMATQSLADENHLYRLDIDPSALSSFSHKIVVNDAGIITAATSTVTDAVTPFIFNSVKSLASFAGGGAALNSSNYCSELRKTEAFIKGQDAKLEALKDRRIAVVDTAKPHVDAKAFELKLKFLDEKISNFKKAMKEEEAKFGTKIHKKTYVIVAELTPPDTQSDVVESPQWAVYKPKFETKEDDSTPKRISFLPGNAKKTLDRLQDPESSLTALLNTMTVEFDLGQAKPLDPCSVTDPECRQHDGDDTHGYKYRIPKTSRLKVSASGKTIASSDIQVAQFGSVVSLPEKFFGAKGTMDLAFNENTGGLSSATIGADPISSTAVSQYVDVAKDYRTAETAAAKAKKEELKAEEAAAVAETTSEARADIDAALIEIERLEALKKLRDLRIELGLPAE